MYVDPAVPAPCVLAPPLVPRVISQQRSGTLISLCD
jgi:hypothetical protein